jgi:hypothetical protein
MTTAYGIGITLPTLHANKTITVRFNNTPTFGQSAAALVGAQVDLTFSQWVHPQPAQLTVSFTPDSQGWPSSVNLHGNEGQPVVQGNLMNPLWTPNYVGGDGMTVTINVGTLGADWNGNAINTVTNAKIYVYVQSTAGVGLSAISQLVSYLSVLTGL